MMMKGSVLRAACAASARPGWAKITWRRDLGKGTAGGEGRGGLGGRKGGGK